MTVSKLNTIHDGVFKGIKRRQHCTGDIRFLSHSQLIYPFMISFWVLLHNSSYSSLSYSHSPPSPRRHQCRKPVIPCLVLHFQKLSPSCTIILIRVKNVYALMPALSISGKIRMMCQLKILPLSAGCSLIALPCPNMHLFPFNRNLLHRPWSIHEVANPRDSTQHSFAIGNLKPPLTALCRSRLDGNDKFP